jgi:SAM-dependent methyltransferase
MDALIESYGDWTLHREIGCLIERHSQNRFDIRSVAAPLLKGRNISSIIDIGCGYGWFEEGLEGPYERVVGIDCHGENERPFLTAARRVAAAASFLKLRLPAPIPVADGTFDLAVAAYSLYFFPESLGEIRRVLKSGGVLLVITHSESMMEEGERHFSFTNLRALIGRFSAENGEARLKAHFSKVEIIDYPNALVFPRGSIEDLEKYIDFKREFIVRDADPVLVKAVMSEELERAGEVRLNKNDRIFLALA